MAFAQQKIHQCSSEDIEIICTRDGIGQVPTGGSHYGSVPSSQCCQAAWNGHSWREPVSVCNYSMSDITFFTDHDMTSCRQ